MSSGHPLHQILHPRSIAVVGVSANELREGITGWLPRLLNFGYQGHLYPVNPRASEILGLRAYPSLKDIPETVDYVIFNIPARLAPQIMEDCVAKGVKAVHVFTAGFSETGKEEGRRLEEELSHIIRGSGVRIIGPNCMGIYHPKAGLTFYPAFSKESGSVALVSQTGAGAIRFVLLANERGIRFSKVISYGNAIDLDASDFLEYLAGDEETKVIACYIEGVKGGRAFLKAVKECMRRKPVIILKAGVTEGGAAAAASHTAALAGSEWVWGAFFKQTGVIPVESLEEMVDVVLALLHFPCPRGPRVGIVGRGGGIGVIATDLCERAGLSVPSFAPETRSQLEKVNPEAGASVRNPVETALGLAGASQFYQEGLQVVDADPHIDFILTHIGVDVYGRVGSLEETVDILIETAKTLTKPMVVALYAGASLETIAAVAQAQQRCLEAGLAVYPTVEAAVKAVSKVIRYHQFIKETRLEQLVC